MRKLKAALVLTTVIAAAILIVLLIIKGGAFLFDGFAGLLNRSFDMDLSKSEVAVITIVPPVLIGFIIGAFKFMSRISKL